LITSYCGIWAHQLAQDLLPFIDMGENTQLLTHNISYTEATLCPIYKQLLGMHAAGGMHQSVVCLRCRKEFGNNPDISKALRLLVSEKNVKRAGKGGRIDPFTYKVGLALPLCLLTASFSSHFVTCCISATTKQCSVLSHLGVTNQVSFIKVYLRQLVLDLQAHRLNGHVFYVQPLQHHFIQTVQALYAHCCATMLLCGRIVA